MRRRSALREKNYRFRGSAGGWDCPANWPARHKSAPAGAHTQFTGRKMLAKVPLAGLSFFTRNYLATAGKKDRLLADGLYENMTVALDLPP